ncbi:MAG: hypothetical protein JO321_08845 [Solirubrobacterales bacterium]|nr:hypothetical protein [Solirubrobacterales bacterium]
MGVVTLAGTTLARRVAHIAGAWHDMDVTVTGQPPDSEHLAATRAPSDSDLALLGTYEPVARCTRGELFLPTAVGPYVAQCGLWAGVHGEKLTPLVVPGALTLERLSEEAVRDRDRPLFLRFVAKPLGRSEYLSWRKLRGERLGGASRFTTTGVFGRLIDAGVRASLLLRGRVPAGAAAAAEIIYRERLDAGRFTYYGRVVREGGYVCLQYWFFYAMNDWRSTFGGINDHEADWEMVTVYLAERGDRPPRPSWVAFSSHDYHGDDLRRRWDDPELRREGTHPVLFVGAGSHSGAFIPGDYVVSVDPVPLRRMLGVMRKLRRLLAPWRHYTGEPGGLGIPFVDYARGDGVAIGPGHERAWSPAVIDDETPWVRDYRGLWGLDTRDRFGGERAPSGPRYERNGSVRTSWANPLGWAGLLKVPPDDDDQQFAEALKERVAAVDRELSELDVAIEAERAALRTPRAEARSLRSSESSQDVAKAREAEVVKREQALNQSIANRTALAEERRAHLATIRNPPPPDPPQAHIRRPHRPQTEQQERRTRFLKIWAAVSTPLLLATVIVELIISPLAFFTTIAALILVFSGVEAIARRRLLSFLASLALLVFGIALLVGLTLLFLKHWRTALAVLVGIAALVLLAANFRELRRH